MNLPNRERSLLNSSGLGKLTAAPGKSSAEAALTWTSVGSTPTCQTVGWGSDPTKVTCIALGVRSDPSLDPGTLSRKT